MPASAMGSLTRTFTPRRARRGPRAPRDGDAALHVRAGLDERALERRQRGGHVVDVHVADVPEADDLARASGPGRR